MQEDTSSSSSTSLFFSRRAKFVPTKSAEELKAASELLDKIQEEKSKITKVPKIKASYAQKSNIEEDEVADTFPIRKSARGAKKVVPKITDIVEDIINDNVCDMYLSPAAKRRLKKQQVERKLELKRIEEENNRILSEVNASEFNEEVVETPVYNFDKVHVLTISYLSEVSRLKCYENEKFSTLFPKVADLLKLKVTDFLLCLRETNISMNDTPKSLNLSDSDVLDCIPYKSDGKTDIEIEYDQDKLKIAFQSNDNDEKVDLLVHKVEKMQAIMERYAEMRNLPLNSLKFEFDGEMLLGTETPEELDMESGNCIDVKVSAGTSKISNIESGNHVDEIILNSDAESVDDNVIFLDSNSGSGNNVSDDVVVVNTVNNAPATGFNPFNTIPAAIFNTLNIAPTTRFNPLNVPGMLFNAFNIAPTTRLRTPRRRRTPSRGNGTPARRRGTPTKGQGTPTKGRGNSARGRGNSVRGRGTPTKGQGTSARGQGTSSRGRGTPTKKRGSPSKRRGRSRGRQK